ncbi:unnamed protein product, partial [Brenthis ino]
MSGTREEMVKSALKLCLNVVKSYEWLLDLYVLDFFVDDHWMKLPKLWRDSFSEMDPQDLGNILIGHLVRILTYKYNLSTMGIEMQTKLSEEARYVIGNLI